MISDKVYKHLLLISFLLILILGHFYQPLLCIGIENKNSSYVMLDGQKLFEIKNPISAESTKERAEKISERLKVLINQPGFNIESIKIEHNNGYSYLVSGPTTILFITNDDAKIENKTRDELAQFYRERIKIAIKKYYKEHSLYFILKNIFLISITTLFLALLFNLSVFLYTNIVAKLKMSEIKIPKIFQFVLKQDFLSILATCIKFLWTLVAVSILYFYLSFILSLFTLTHNYSEIMLSLFYLSIKNSIKSIISYLPNLFFILVVIIIANYISKTIKFFSNNIHREKLKIPGFYSEWAKPTYKIIQFFIWAFVIATIFPYLPGADTEAFKGISVFIGALITIGSSSSVANILSGTIITYTRAFKDGDVLKIADTFGFVIEKTLLVTRIKTVKNEIISIPNSIVLTNHIINYSSDIDDSELILHTSVTIGYDAPWRKIHELLIAAAKETGYILKTPEPFVLQKSLDDFFVTYEINAYTKEYKFIPRTYSELHQNIQDKFNEAGMEIMSPHYNSLRDGNQIAIPDEYIAKSYKSPRFKIEP